MFDAEKKNAKETWDRQVLEMVRVQGDVEGKDERVYAVDMKTKKDS